ncbi:MAG: hypothetical protein SF051_02020 [Elusimicrobiota bacterium]|nr:hypothetical protein [Elusimicrobiota bacterium]
MKAFAAAVMLAAVSAHAEPVTPAAPAQPRPRLVAFFSSALGPETVLQFAQCADSPADFVYALDFSWSLAEQGITVGCLDGRGEPNTTTIRMDRYNRGRAVPIEVVQVDIGPDLYQLWEGRPGANADYFVGELDADNARRAIAAAAASVRQARAADAAMRAAEELGLPCP